jgi:tetratricopeptide (TPR) repeat protein
MFIIICLLTVSACGPIIRHESSKHFEEGNRWSNSGNYERAVEAYNLALEKDPDFAMALHNRGFALARLGAYDQAIEDFNRALTVDPKNALIYYNRGTAWDKKGDYHRALQDFNRAIQLKPDNPDVFCARGIVLDKLGQYGKAVDDLIRTLQLDPGYEEALGNLAWIFATCPDGAYRNGERAIDLAQKAMDMDATPYRLDTLAAAYAEAGRFHEAVRTQQQAIQQFSRLGNAALMAGALERLNAYKARTPWREK